MGILGHLYPLHRYRWAFVDFRRCVIHFRFVDRQRSRLQDRRRSPMSFSAPEPYPSSPNLWDFSDEDEPFYVQDCFNLLFFYFKCHNLQDHAHYRRFAVAALQAWQD